MFTPGQPGSAPFHTGASVGKWLALLSLQTVPEGAAGPPSLLPWPPCARAPGMQGREVQLLTLRTCVCGSGGVWRATSKATLWMKAHHKGALTPPCIVWKKPQVPHTARQVACHSLYNLRGKRSSIPPHKTRPDSPVPTLHPKKSQG